MGEAVSLALGLVLTGCGATVDPLGKLPAGGTEPEPAPEPAPSFDSDSLKPLTGPSQYTNAFSELLGISTAMIRAKLDAEFEQLFHGDPGSQAIYFTVGSDQAYILDVFHGDTRSEGIALGMLIALELDRREEFDRLWRFAAASLRYASGPQRGYFRSTCSDGPCSDPYGQQMLATVLLFAHGRWGSHSGDIDYGAEALAILQDLRSHEADLVADVTSMFDANTGLVVDEPNSIGASRTRPSNVMPAAYQLWAQATGDGAWQTAAESGRGFWTSSAHATTGLLPLRANFDGQPVPGSDAFVPEGYRALLNMALDHSWFEPMTWYGEQSDRLLGFFAGQGLELYGSSYPLDGARCIDCAQTMALVAMNGVSAVASQRPDRTQFVQAVWDSELREGPYRYYDNLLQMLALLYLSGELRVY